MEEFQSQYKILGIHPDATWDQLRTAYKQKMRRWHPDKLGRDASARHQAEEFTKQINQAYQELSEYYKHHGRLPLHAAPTQPPPIPVKEYSASPASPQHHAANQNQATTQAPRSSTRLTLIVFSVVVVIALYTLRSGEVDQALEATTLQSVVSATAPGSPAADGSQGPAIETLGKQEVRTGFGLGSTLGDVYSTQGVPTKVAGDVWHYGEARVYFEKGQVVRWSDSSPSILRIDASAGSFTARKTAGATFDVGSSKEDVQTAQGSPNYQSEQEWGYGQSRVYFDNSGKVIRWNESPFDPLRVRR